MQSSFKICLLVSLFLSLVGCEKKDAPANSDAASTAAAEDTTPKPKESNKIEIKGSDSEVNVVQHLAELFMKNHPDVKISVTGGGSGAGITSLLDGTVQISNSSRPLASAEKVKAVKNKVSPFATVFATDVLSIAVHADNPITSLTVDQLAQIFRGEVDDWSAFGGKGKITAYGRQPSSGTYVFFKDTVVKGDYGSQVMQMNGNAQIVESIAKDVGGIGYVAVGYVNAPNSRIKALAVAPKEGDEPVMPTNETAVANGVYPIARPLFQYTNGAPTGVVLEFLKFEISAEGQSIVKEMGFYPVRETDSTQYNNHLK